MSPSKIIQKSRRRTVKYVTCRHCRKQIKLRGFHGHLRLSRACRLAEDILHDRLSSRIVAHRFLDSFVLTKEKP